MRDRCECSCHREESHHISPCCYTCLRCKTDRIKPIDYGHGERCKLCETFAKLTDDELRLVSKGEFKFDPRKHGLSITSVEVAIDADIELARRALEQTRR